jgi:Na+/H+-dicarboxylate symporter
VLSLLLLAFAVGVGLSKLPGSENKNVVVKGLLGLQDLLFLLIRWLIWALPLGIVAFSAQLLAQVSAGVVAWWKRLKMCGQTRASVQWLTAICSKIPCLWYVNNVL